MARRARLVVWVAAGTHLVVVVELFRVELVGRPHQLHLLLELVNVVGELGFDCVVLHRLFLSQVVHPILMVRNTFQALFCLDLFVLTSAVGIAAESTVCQETAHFSSSKGKEARRTLSISLL